MWEDLCINCMICFIGVSESNLFELVVVICCSGNRLSNCQVIESIMGCKWVFGFFISSNGCVFLCNCSVFFVCNSVEKSFSRII